jgi:Tol biopolymer transport system component
LLAPGTRLGPYEIDAALASGGMGHVYRARDTRLDRAVAIKVLQTDLSENLHARERFEYEARAISHINHPHICTLYDIGEEGGVSFLVMELLEGETLAVRLQRGPLPIDQAIAFAGQIADALDKTHRVGIVHGDLKPENIMLTKAGVKLLDFGLSRRAPAAQGSTDSVTTATTIGAPGVVVGTLQYLSPEQLEGKPPDARSDIFGLGAVIYEMVTGKKAFNGQTPAAVIAAIMKHDPPPVSELRPGTPPALEHVVDTCLAKDPDERWQHAGDLARELAWVGASAPMAPATASAGGRRWIWIATSAALLVLLAALGAWALMDRVAPDVFPTRTSVLLPEGLQFPAGGAVAGVSRFAISPDGRKLAFVAIDAGGNQRLWVRALDSVNPAPIAGTDGALSPFWSPDSGTIAFVAQGRLKTVDVKGGTPVVIASPAANTTGAWTRDNVILFTPTFTSPLSSVPASGGTPQQVTTLDKAAGDVLHRSPTLLPDGKHFLYVAAGPRAGGTIGPRAVYVGSMDRQEPAKLLLDSGTGVRYGQGHVIFVRENTLMAQPFDLDRLALSGEPRPVAEQVELMAPGWASFALSDSGLLAYQPSSEGSQLVWFNRGGQELGTVDGAAGYDDLELSPDGHRAAVSVVDPAVRTRDLWIFDVDRGVRTRLTADNNDDVAPIWSPDGARLAFASNRNGHYDLFEKGASGLDGETSILADDAEKYPIAWLKDGRRLLWSVEIRAASTGVSILPAGQNQKPVRFLGPPVNTGRLSPDERWLAYTSPESGRSEVYVVPFPMASRRWPVSTAGGTQPRWRRDGKELFYAGRDNRLMAVTIDASGRDLKIGEPQPLFEARPVGARSFYDVSPDGRFLVNVVRADSASPSITLVQNWTAALKP